MVEDHADEGVLHRVGPGEGVDLALVQGVGAVLVDESVQAVG